MRSCDEETCWQNSNSSFVTGILWVPHAARILCNIVRNNVHVFRKKNSYNRIISKRRTALSKILVYLYIDLTIPSWVLEFEENIQKCQVTRTLCTWCPVQTRRTSGHAGTVWQNSPHWGCCRPSPPTCFPQARTCPLQLESACRDKYPFICCCLHLDRWLPDNYICLKLCLVGLTFQTS